ncbi:uncharacterized protein BKCO1_8100024 [Diplodia corticola]|uniref:Uncharacterized protein n=1 Tax=Diplodia corticola TaxID=236234 RepID=A0A1J9RAI1_9PEZI|nr:uncharacterized protein BKCO1_8100024 [Diplodia corticola]OJD29427.1 hypothetical protein BKCO1_8100024 [Diplodia corticola]
MPSTPVYYDESTMFDVVLSPISPSAGEQIRHQNVSPTGDTLGERQNEPESRLLVESPSPPLSAQQQCPESPPTHPDGEIVKVPPLLALGQTTIIMLSTSTILIIAVMALLTYLWANQSNTSSAGPLWRLIVVGSWLPQVITLCTLVLRWATAVQLCLFTSMLASVAVEGFQVTLSQIMAVSIMRATTARPAELLWALLQGNRYILWGIRTIALTTMLMLLQASFQFSSTILLSDLYPGVVRGNAGAQEVSYGLSEGLQAKLGSDSMGNPWTFKPPFWPSFAEYAEPAIEAPGMADTGFTLRAFLPFETAQSRLAVGNYSGPATIIPSRVTCFKPPLSKLAVHIAHEELSAGFITGEIDFGEVQFELLGGCKSRPCRETPESTHAFNCTFNYGASSAYREWAATLCVVEDSLGTHQFSRTSSPYFGNGYLLINASGAVEDWYGLGQRNSGSPSDLTPSSSTDASAWTKFDTPSPGASVSSTLCYYNPSPLNYHDVNASRDAPPAAEPRFRWTSTNTTTTTPAHYDTASVRKQLGAATPPRSLTHQARGILTLSHWAAAPHTPSTPPPPLLFPQQHPVNAINSSYTLCQQCVRQPSRSANTDANTPVHHTLTTLFQDVLLLAATSGDDDNPARALQALFTTVAQAAYYALASEFDVVARNASVAAFIGGGSDSGNGGSGGSGGIAMPRRWRGFAVVAGMVVGHFACGGVVVGVFLGGCRCSMVGQVWGCVAQVRGGGGEGDVDAVLGKARRWATDGEVRAWLEECGWGETRVGVLPWRRRRRMRARARGGEEGGV